MEITIKFKNEDGNDEITPVTVEIDVPNYKEFITFREGFDILERSVLKARKEVTEQALESYMEEVSKKKSAQQTRKYKVE